MLCEKIVPVERMSSYSLATLSSEYVMPWSSGHHGRTELCKLVQVFVRILRDDVAQQEEV